MTPLHLTWRDSFGLLQGEDMTTGEWVSQPFNHGPGFPGEATESKTIVISTSGLLRSTFDILKNVQLYLKAEASVKQLLTVVWPETGDGVEVSFDSGATWQLMTAEPILVPITVPGEPAAVNDLSPFDSIEVLTRIRIPSSYSTYSTLDFSFGIGCDIV